MQLSPGPLLLRLPQGAHAGRTNAEAAAAPGPDIIPAELAALLARLTGEQGPTQPAAPLPAEPTEQPAAPQQQAGLAAAAGTEAQQAGGAGSQVMMADLDRLLGLLATAPTS